MCLLPPRCEEALLPPRLAFVGFQLNWKGSTAIVVVGEEKEHAQGSHQIRGRAGGKSEVRLLSRHIRANLKPTSLVF